MAGQIRVNTEQVTQIAGSIEGLNNRLKETLENSKKTVENLKNTWEGQAADATIESYNAFSAKFFQTYYDVLDQYVKFLRQNVSEGYFQTETANTNLADAFK